MRKLTVLLLLLVVITFFSSTEVMANVFASDISLSASSIDVGNTETTTISFILNEHARMGVEVKIYDGNSTLVRTLMLDKGVQGENSVEWDGKDDQGAFVDNGDYSIKVTAADSGYAEWTMISDSMETNLYYPRGITINNDVNSPYFGRITVSNGEDSLGGVFGDQHAGFYMYNADRSFIGYADGGVEWGGGSSPDKLQIGEDGNLYVCDYSNDIGWQFDQDASPESGIQLFDDTNKDPGQWISGMYVYGTGMDRTIYTADGNWNEGLSTLAIKAYDIGTDEFAEGLGDSVCLRWGAYYTRAVELDNEGNIYVGNFRWGTGQAPSIMKFPPRQDTVMAVADTIWTTDINDWARGVRGIGIDENHGLVGYGEYYNPCRILLFDQETGAFVDSIQVPHSPAIHLFISEIDFDAVGNVYATALGFNQWVVFSRPDGENSFTTPALDMVTVTGSTALDEKSPVVHEFYLKQNYPNPFNPVTEIEFSLAKSGHAILKIYNTLGQEVTTLVNRNMKAGVHRVTFDASNLASGVYIYKLITNNQVISKKMSVVK